MATKIALSGSNSEGLFALVDDEDAEKVKRFKWYLVDGRPRANWGRGRQMRMHHFVFGKPTDGLVTDHINGDPLDNRKENLQFVMQQYNNLKSKRRTKGYYYDKSRNKWAVSIGKGGGRSLNGGRYDTEEEAAAAADWLREYRMGIV